MSDRHSLMLDFDFVDSSSDDESFYSLAQTRAGTIRTTATERRRSTLSISESRYELAMIPKYYGSDDDASVLSIDEEVIVHHERMDPVLFQPLAAGVSLFSQSARLSLALTGAISNTLLSTARWSSEMTIGIGRSIIVGALSSARILQSGSSSESISSLEKITDSAIKVVTDVFSLAELFTYGTWHLADSSVRFSLTAATETIQILDGVFGSTETSRAISSIVTLIQDEARRSILSAASVGTNNANTARESTVLSTLGSIAVLGSVAKALTAFACLQTVTYRRSLRERRRVEKVFDGTVDKSVLDTGGKVNLQWEKEKLSYAGEMSRVEASVTFKPVPKEHGIERFARARIEEIDENIVTLDDAKAFVQETGLQGSNVKILDSVDSFRKAGELSLFSNTKLSVSNGGGELEDRVFLDKVVEDFSGKNMDGLVGDFERSSRSDVPNETSKSGGKAWSFFKGLYKLKEPAEVPPPIPSKNDLDADDEEENKSKLGKIMMPFKGKSVMKTISKRKSIVTMFDETRSVQQGRNGNIERFGFRFDNNQMMKSEYLAFISATVPDDTHIYKQYPLPHLLRNFERYCRFSSASYGAEFMKLMGVGKLRDIHSTDNSIHANHFAFSIHAGIPVTDILHSSFMSDTSGLAQEKPTMDAVINYVTLDRAAKVVVVALRGTMALNDILTDLKFDYATFMGHKVHSGMLRSAALLYKKGAPLREIVRTALESNPTYGLVLTGHSLGAGVAALLSIRWACRTYELGIDPKSPFFPPTPFVTSGRGGFPRGRPIHCYAYGSPCVVSFDMSVRAKGLVSTLVNGDDIVPTLSVGLVRDMKAVTMSLLDSENRGLSERIIWKTLGFQASAVRGSSSSGSNDGEDYFWDVLTRLRGRMQNERLFVAGTAYWMVSSETVASSSTDTKSTWHVTFERCDDVREMSQEPRFSSHLISDHFPTNYEQTLGALLQAVFK
ncbi:hypothetical protein HK100_008346 [Physocladia obscura]|uniref:sn-1-specific diacylglycerol lipase n=1 Tax=Physocladia obscura TaxID=109957 RepID=A0AAD5T4A5_9FUNG|nr:hypothetical protein HK100_008346 [Physocladia obscura]